MNGSGTNFCIECRKEVKYNIVKEKQNITIKGVDYEFDVLVARCSECNEEIGLPELLDYNAKFIDDQYRAKEELVTIDEIKDLMEIYDIGKTPLSLVLGFGEITLTRYLNGQYPSKQYSDIIRKALASPDYIIQCLDEHKDKIKDTAYKKAYVATSELQTLIGKLSHNILLVISYIFSVTDEITPLALQKTLYYIQSLSLVINKKEMFPEDCYAWAHGPVYSNVYNVFKSFKYNPIDDKRFSLFKYQHDKLLEEDKYIINLVLDTFGQYNGKVLEKITHKESPWKDVYVDNYLYNEIITKDSMRIYFDTVLENNESDVKETINNYINRMIK